MHDVETGTWWSHILGQGMRGELEGTLLEPISTSLMTWGTWFETHPDTTVLNMTRARMSVQFDHSRDFYEDLALWVYGWSVGLQKYHVPLSALSAEPVLNATLQGASLVATFDEETTDVRLFSRRVGDRELTFTAAGDGGMRDEQTGTVWDVATGEAVDGTLEGERLDIHLGMLSYTNAWESFFPASVRLPQR